MSMPELIYAGKIEVYPNSKVQVWREAKDNPDPELATLYLRSTPTRKNAEELRKMVRWLRLILIETLTKPIERNRYFHDLQAAENLLDKIEQEEPK